MSVFATLPHTWKCILSRAERGNSGKPRAGARKRPERKALLSWPENCIGVGDLPGTLLPFLHRLPFLNFVFTAGDDQFMAG
jgi:hypothetical protein